MIEETGIVIKTDGITATVAVQKRGACEGCAAKGVCETTDAGMEVEALNPVHAKVGQTVEVSIKPRTYLKGSIIVYGFPLIAFVAGVIAGKDIGERYFKGIDSDIISVVLGFALLIISFLIIKVWSRQVESKEEYKPVIEKIIE